MILDEILEAKREEARKLKGRQGFLLEEARSAPPPRDFVGALRADGEVAVVAEFKRRSPSAGELWPAADPAAVARGYRDAGAAALSVLTDARWFGGSLDDLEAAREASGLPVLRKDFLVDPVQVIEARAAGADAVLLIVRALSDSQLGELLAAAGELGAAALVEVHDEAELERAVSAGAGAIGVNARDLATLEVDLEAAHRVVSRVPPDRAAVAESGVREPEDVRRAGEAGADAVLVGSALMEGGGGRAVAALVGQPRAPRGSARTGRA